MQLNYYFYIESKQCTTGNVYVHYMIIRQFCKYRIICTVNWFLVCWISIIVLLVASTYCTYWYVPDIWYTIALFKVHNVRLLTDGLVQLLCSAHMHNVPHFMCVWNLHNVPLIMYTMHCSKLPWLVFHNALTSWHVEPTQRATTSWLLNDTLIMFVRTL